MVFSLFPDGSVKWTHAESGQSYGSISKTQADKFTKSIKTSIAKALPLAPMPESLRKSGRQVGSIRVTEKNGAPEFGIHDYPGGCELSVSKSGVATTTGTIMIPQPIPVKCKTDSADIITKQVTQVLNSKKLPLPKFHEAAWFIVDPDGKVSEVRSIDVVDKTKRVSIPQPANKQNIVSEAVKLADHLPIVFKEPDKPAAFVTIFSPGEPHPIRTFQSIFAASTGQNSSGSTLEFHVLVPINS